ncbi:right-handed parallel beta-helix repeat-containing protein [Salmonella enterica]|uniref:phage tail fiber domain-containing protein n=1 Tax=Salmonella enterica TaxID=28901 RepID=UPI00256FC9AF|nr:phage tail fiber protein [Salmonella enterica]EKP8674472.1 right-handed parallel beta-helix repeat-containing protein [Salmonella enterica]MDL4013570.1 phage tail fiber protein [Salmonella enterica]MDL4081984.1 phage tail fiber protein [Salmonella enterica]MDL4132037.1 phage tail fiber protein [Salmonella enterica]MDL4135758.1 phage tail fiber protein [Salmonella enterica]
MSVPNQTPYIIYNANGLTTVFPFEFYIINTGDIQVSINGTTVTSGYTVAGAGNVSGGDVVFLTPPESGSVVMLERVVPTYRLTDYQDNGDLLADTINKDFDRLWMAIQRSSIYLGLALRRPLLGGPYDAQGYRIAGGADPINNQDFATKNYVDNVSLGKTLRVPEAFIKALPGVEQRKNKIVAMDSAGQPVMVVPESGSAADVMLELAAGNGFSRIGQFESISELMSTSGGRDGDRVLVKSYYPGANTGGGEFSWNATTTAGADGGYIIRPTGVTVGAWVRVSKVNQVSLSQYGVVGNDDDVSNKVLAAFTMANILQKEINLDTDYRAQNIVIDGYKNVRVRGVGKGKLVDNCNKVLFTFKNCDGLDIYGIDVDGNRMNQTSTTQPGTPDGVGLIRVEQCNNWKIHHCDIHDNRLGAAVIIVDNGANTSTNWQSSIQNGYLHKNYIHDCGVAGVVMSDAVFSWSHNTIISDNVIRRCTDYGIALDYSQRIVVKDNIISDVLVVMGVLGVRDALIDGNNYDSAELGIAVTLSGNPAQNPYISRNVTITNNKGRDIVSSTLLADGIYVDPSAEFVHVEGNTIANAKRGISVPCSFANVINNTAIDCRDTSFYIDTKRGKTLGNESFNSDGSLPVKSFISGQSSKQLYPAGVQRVGITKNIGQSTVKICTFNSIGQYSAAFVTVKFAGLVNSLGATAASKSYILNKSGNVYTITDSGSAGDTTNVVIDVNQTSGKPELYLHFAQGAATDVTVLVDLESPGESDSIFYITDV